MSSTPPRYFLIASVNPPCTAENTAKFNANTLGGPLNDPCAAMGGLPGIVAACASSVLFIAPKPYPSTEPCNAPPAETIATSTYIHHDDDTTLRTRQSYVSTPRAPHTATMPARADAARAKDRAATRDTAPRSPSTRSRQAPSSSTPHITHRRALRLHPCFKLFLLCRDGVADVTHGARRAVPT